MARILWAATMFVAMCAITVAAVTDPVTLSAPSVTVYKNAQ